MKHTMRAWAATPLGEDESARGELLWIGGHSARGASSSASGNASSSASSSAGESEASQAEAEVEVEVEVENLGFSEQFALAMASLERTLHEAGASWGDVVNARVYVPRAEDLEGLEARLATFLREDGLALMVLCSALRPGLLFEIECVAVRPRPNLHVGG